jgi:uncharacterized protein
MVSGRGEPERMCVGCRATAPKRILVRFVRSTDGGVDLDRTGHAPGRGAYAHLDAACLGLAVNRGAVARALRVRLGKDEAGRLLEELGRGDDA